MSLVDVLEVDVLEARDLAPKDDGVSSDPYCTVEIRSQDQAVLRRKKSTKVIDKTLNPKWNELNVVGGQEYLPSSTTAYVLFEVFDKDVVADDFEGQIEVPILSVLDAPNKNLDAWFPLKPHVGKKEKVTGEIHVVIRVIKRPLRMENAKRITRFLKLLMNDCLPEVLELFHPELRNYIDAPLLRQWAVYHRDTLGLMRNRQPTVVSSTTDKVSGLTRSVEQVRLERGAVDYTLVWLNNLIVEFTLNCGEVPPFTWLTQVPAQLFHDRALNFLRLATSEATIKQAWEMMHPGLRRAFGSETSAIGLCNKAVGKLGVYESSKLADPTVLSAPQGPTSHDGLVPKLALEYRSKWASGTSLSNVIFALDGFHARVIGYSLILPNSGKQN